MKKLINTIIIISSTIIGVYSQQTPVWPVASSVTNHNQINCTFGEKHSLFHGALDLHTGDGTKFLGILDGKINVMHHSNHINHNNHSSDSGMEKCLNGDLQLIILMYIDYAKA